MGTCIVVLRWLDDFIHVSNPSKKGGGRAWGKEERLGRDAKWLPINHQRLPGGGAASGGRQVSGVANVLLQWGPKSEKPELRAGARGIAGQTMVMNRQFNADQLSEMWPLQPGHVWLPVDPQRR